MKNQFYLFALLLFLSTNSITAQWTEESQFGQVIQDLAVFDNKLFVVGGFTEREGSTCYWSSTYDGVSFSNHTGLIGGGGIRQLAVFNDELYSVGSLLTGFNSGVAKWNGSTWTNGGDFSSSHSGIYVDGNDLYVGSDFGVVSKKTGSGSFEALPQLDEGSDNVYEVSKYNGQIIIAGEIDSYNSVELNNIASWDGSGWQPVGDGLSGGDVRCMAVYNSELYAGGLFSTASGSDAKFIAKWDGTSWTDVGGSMTGEGYNGIRDMMVYNDRLYVVGDFDEMGGVAARYVAVWDGQDWTGLSLEAGDSHVNCIAAYDDHIYIGTFDFEDAYLYSTNVPTNVEESSVANLSLSVYPNPSTDQIALQRGQTNLDLSVDVLDMSGALVQSSNFPEQSLKIDCEQWNSGQYLLLLRDTKTQQVLSTQTFSKL